MGVVVVIWCLVAYFGVCLGVDCVVFGLGLFSWFCYG